MKHPFIALIFFFAAHSAQTQNNLPFIVTYTTFPPGTAHGVASADFNLDGKKDLVVSIFTGSTVLVYPGNGDGTFGTPTSFAVGKNPTMVLTADINKDNKPDIITPNYNSGDVSILLGSGNGSFSAATHLSAGTSPHCAVAKDLNGDGKIDIATCNFQSDNMHVYMGDGTGTFLATSVYTTGSGPVTLVANDVDNDGDIDLISADHWSATSSVFLNNASGVFSSFTYTGTQAGPYGLACENFNSDQFPDILTLNGNSSDCSVNFLQGSASGTFSTANYSLPITTGLSAAAADYDKDGKMDFVSAHSHSGFYFKGNGDGTFNAPVEFSSLKYEQMKSVITDDFNNDGMQDVAFVYFTPNKISVMLNTLPKPVTGLDERTRLKEKLLIYNKPGKGTMALKASEKMNISVYNDLGQLLWSGTLDEHNEFSSELNLRHGIYFVSAASAGGYDKRKVWLGE